MPHRDYSVGYGKDPVNHGWIVTLPLSNEGSWLFIYNDDHSEKRLVHIPFGTMFTMRSDVYHGGCLGSEGNVRMQISFVVCDMVNNYRLLGHVSEATCKEHNIYHPKTFDRNTAVSLVDSDTEIRLKAQAEAIRSNYIGGEEMLLN